MIHVRHDPNPLLLPVYSPAPETTGPGPFFSVQSHCEDDPTYSPWFCVMRGRCDILFPTGTIPRAYQSQSQANEAVTYCNQLAARVEHLVAMQQQAAGMLADMALDRQIEGLLEELFTRCFLTERELCDPDYLFDQALAQRN